MATVSDTLVEEPEQPEQPAAAPSPGAGHAAGVVRASPVSRRPRATSSNVPVTAETLSPEELLQREYTSPEGLAFRPFAGQRPVLNKRRFLWVCCTYGFMPCGLLAILFRGDRSVALSATAKRRANSATVTEFERGKRSSGDVEAGRSTVNPTHRGANADAAELRRRALPPPPRPDLHITRSKIARAVLWMVGVAALVTFYAAGCHRPGRSQCHNVPLSEVWLTVVLYLLYTVIKAHTLSLKLVEEVAYDDYGEKLWLLGAVLSNKRQLIADSEPAPPPTPTASRARHTQSFAEAERHHHHHHHHFDDMMENPVASARRGVASADPTVPVHHNPLRPATVHAGRTVQPTREAATPLTVHANGLPVYANRNRKSVQFIKGTAPMTALELIDKVYGAVVKAHERKRSMRLYTSGGHHVNAPAPSTSTASSSTDVVWNRTRAVCFLLCLVQALLGPVFRVLTVDNPCQSQATGFNALRCGHPPGCNVYQPPPNIIPCDQLACHLNNNTTGTSSAALFFGGGSAVAAFIVVTASVCTALVSYALYRALFGTVTAYWDHFHIMTLIHHMLRGHVLAEDARHVTRHTKYQLRGVPSLNLELAEDVAVAYTVQTQLKSAANLYVRVSGWVPLLWFLATDVGVLAGVVVNVLVQRRGTAFTIDTLRTQVLYSTSVVAIFVLMAMLLAYRSNDKQAQHLHGLLRTSTRLSFKRRETQLNMEHVAQQMATSLSPAPQLREEEKALRQERMHQRACLDILGRFADQLKTSDKYATIFGVRITAVVFLQTVAVIFTSAGLQLATTVLSKLAVQQTVNSQMHEGGVYHHLKCVV